MRICENNLRMSDSFYTPHDIAAIFADFSNQWDTLTFFHEDGRSKSIKNTPIESLLLQKPGKGLHYCRTLAGARYIAELEPVRHSIARFFWDILHGSGIRTNVLAHNDQLSLVTKEKIPPISVACEFGIGGITLGRHDYLFEMRDRFGKLFSVEDMYPITDISFEYANRTQSPEVMARAFADRFVDTNQAEKTAQAIAKCVQFVLGSYGLILLKLSLTLDQSGTILCGEITPDNFLCRRADKQEFEKPVIETNILSNWITIKNMLGV